MTEIDLKTLSRFWCKVIKTGNCWEWAAGKDKDGYGQFNIKGKNIRAHRFAYELLKEDIPTGLVIDHLCRKSSCVNPDHMEVVSS